MKLLTPLLLFVPLMAGFAQVANQFTPAYFTVYNPTADNTVSQQFVIKITDPAIIQQARNMLAEPQSERTHVMGVVVKAPSYFNAPWMFHLDPVSIRFFDFSVEVCDASTSYLEDHLGEVGEAFLPDSVWCPWSSTLQDEVPEPAGAANYIRVASAASGREQAISPGALVSIFGQNLTDRTEQADSSAWPRTLAGVTVEIKGQSEANSHQVPLLFASPSQVNALIPADMPPGPVSVFLKSTSGSTFEAASYLEAVAPALFVVSENNNDHPAASILRIRADGTRSSESLVVIDPGSGRLVPTPLDFGSPTDELYLSLYGTGFAKSSAQAVSVTLASENAPVLFAGPQGQVAGLDQVNISLPQSLRDQPFFDLQPLVQNPNGYPLKANAVRIVVGGSAGSSDTRATK